MRGMNGMHGMYDAYGYGYNGGELDLLFYSMFMVVAGILIVALLIGLTIWVFKALALQRIAKRRGISNGWLSWLPVGQDWIIGSISDQYQYLVHGKVCNKRKLLLWFSAGVLLSGVVNLIFTVRFTWMGVNAGLYGYRDFAAFGTGIGYILTMLLIVGVGITCYVLRCIAMYSLYRSCEPKNAVAYLVLGIFFAFLEPVFLFICRNKDQGMPPRRNTEPFAQDPERPCYGGTQDTTYL